MHILAVSHAYPRRSNSSHGSFIHRLHVAMRDLGARIDVLQPVEWAPPHPVSTFFEPWRIARDKRNDMLDELDGIAIHHPPVVIPRPSRLFPGDPWHRYSRALARYCVRREGLARADVVLGHFFVPDGVHALELGRALDVPVAALAWGDDIHAWPERSPEWRERLVEVLQGVDLPIACSQRLATEANAWLSEPRDDWRVAYAGIDLESYSPLRDRAQARRHALSSIGSLNVENDLVVLMVGQAVPEKGYVELLDAWASVAPQAANWHLVMIGVKGTLDIPAEVSQRGLAGRAHWLGFQPADLMPELMRAADAFVLPSHNEGLSLSVLEALATGLPTIATDVGGHAEVIRSPDEGWLIPARDVGALRRALCEVTGQPEERLRRGGGGRQAAERVGHPKQNAARLLSDLSDLRVTASRRALVAT